MPRKPVHTFLIQHQQFLSHGAQILQELLDRRFVQTAIKVNVKIKLGLAIPLGRRSDRTRFNTSHINVVFPKIFENIMKNTEMICQFHQHGDTRLVSIQVVLITGMSRCARSRAGGRRFVRLEDGNFAMIIRPFLWPKDHLRALLVILTHVVMIQMGGKRQSRATQRSSSRHPRSCHSQLVATKLDKRTANGHVR